MIFFSQLASLSVISSGSTIDHKLNWRKESCKTYSSIFLRIHTELCDKDNSFVYKGEHKTDFKRKIWSLLSYFWEPISRINTIQSDFGLVQAICDHPPSMLHFCSLTTRNTCEITGINIWSLPSSSSRDPKTLGMFWVRSIFFVLRMMQCWGWTDAQRFKMRSGHHKTKGISDGVSSPVLPRLISGETEETGMGIQSLLTNDLINWIDMEKPPLNIPKGSGSFWGAEHIRAGRVVYLERAWQLSTP